MSLDTVAVSHPWHPNSLHRWSINFRDHAAIDYRDRSHWQIETFHRDAKQRFGLGDFHCRSLGRIDDHVALAYLRYLLRPS